MGEQRRLGPPADLRGQQLSAGDQRARPASPSTPSATTAASICAKASAATRRPSATSRAARPGRVFENLIILGSAHRRRLRRPLPAIFAPTTSSPANWSGRSTPSRIPANSATTPGRKDAWKYAGGVNAWGEISIDEKRGIAYFPLGSPTYDLYGARPPRRQSVRRLPARARRPHRQAALALPACPSRPLGLRPEHRAQAPDRQAQRQERRHRRAADQVRLPLRLQSRHGRAALADRGAPGAARATCPANSPGRRSRSRPSRRRFRACTSPRRTSTPTSTPAEQERLRDVHAERAQRGNVYAAWLQGLNPGARPTWRLQLGRHGGRPDDRLPVRPRRRSAFHDQAVGAPRIPAAPSANSAPGVTATRRRRSVSNACAKWSATAKGRCPHFPRTRSAIATRFGPSPTSCLRRAAVRGRSQAVLRRRSDRCGWPATAYRRSPRPGRN